MTSVYDIIPDCRQPRVIIVGGGQAGAQCALSLRQGGYAGDILILGAEPYLPYQRPPLSKAYLLGQMDAERLDLRAADIYAELDITLVQNCKVTAANYPARQIIATDLATGRTQRLDFTDLVIATGAEARMPAECVGLLETAPVFGLRTRADADRLRPHLLSGRRLLVIGGGYIGLEMAAVARICGLEVVVVERADTILARVAHPLLAQEFMALHTQNGVDVLLGTSLSSLTFDTNGFTVTTQGQTSKTIAADLVVYGIGVDPRTLLTADLGLGPCADGIPVDDDAATTLPHIYAAGDCTQRQLPRFQFQGRLESVQNAIEQGKAAAAHICGAPRPRTEVPWFWSDQYDVKLQIAGLWQSADTCVRRTAHDGKGLALFHLSGGKVIAADCLNAPTEFLGAKQMIDRGTAPDPTRLADPAIPIKTLLNT